MACDRLAQRLARQGAPYRRYGPLCRGYARSIEWQLLGRHLSDHELPFGVHEQVLSMNAEAEQQRSVAVIDVPFAAIAGAREIRRKITCGPGLRIAGGSNVVEPDARQYLLAAAGPGVRDQLADQRQIADRGQMPPAARGAPRRSTVM